MVTENTALVIPPLLFVHVDGLADQEIVGGRRR